VTVGVLLGVGVIGVVNPLKLKTTDLPEQFFEGVGVGVTPIADNSKLTSSHATDGVGVGIGSQSQSKYALKSKVLQLIGVGVGVTHGPL
jgi:hypothetical protein